MLAAQRTMSTSLRTMGYKCHWGDPVPSHTRIDSAKTSLRGCAAGVALFSRLPSFESAAAVAKESLGTCRLCEAFVRLGSLPILCMGCHVTLVTGSTVPMRSWRLRPGGLWPPRHHVSFVGISTTRPRIYLPVPACLRPATVRPTPSISPRRVPPSQPRVGGAPVMTLPSSTLPYCCGRTHGSGRVVTCLTPMTLCVSGSRSLTTRSLEACGLRPNAGLSWSRIPPSLPRLLLTTFSLCNRPFRVFARPRI